jgi:hypothetical protein
MVHYVSCTGLGFDVGSKILGFQNVLCQFRHFGTVQRGTLAHASHNYLQNVAHRH